MVSILNSYLDNGLKIMLKRVPYGRIVSCGIWINQGSKDKHTETNGLSHLIEHLMLKTQSRRSTNTMQKCIGEILDLGYYYNGKIYIFQKKSILSNLVLEFLSKISLMGHVQL